jgi:N-succinyl-L-ornithine transcarbamylase
MKNFININEVKNYHKLIDDALILKKNKSKFNKTNLDITLGLIFFNPSLRTRMSTYKAAKNLGINVIQINLNNDGWKLEFEEGSIMNLNKSEHVKDAAGVISQYCDIVGIRCFPELKNRKYDEKELIIESFRKYSKIPVINLESSCSHPLQALADAITIKENVLLKKPKIVLSWAPHVKPLPHAVANSFVKMALRLNYDITVTNPKGYNLSQSVTENIKIIHDQEKAFENADLIYAKNWCCYDNYGKVMETENNWIINKEKMELTNDAKFMHCLPVRRNVVVTDEILDSSNSLILNQAENRIFSAQIVLKKIIDEI